MQCASCHKIVAVQLHGEKDMCPSCGEDPTSGENYDPDVFNCPKCGTEMKEVEGSTIFLHARRNAYRQPEKVKVSDVIEKKRISLTSWLRWIVVLPGALIAAFLATFPLHWILYIAFAYNGTLLGFIELPPGANIPIERALYPFVIAITFVLAGYTIAPQYKFNTSVVLTALYLISFTSAIFLAPSQFSLEPRGVLALIGLLLALYIAWRKSRHEEMAS